MSEARSGPHDADALASSTLVLLRRLLDAGARSGPTVARRAGLSPHELTALELLVADQHGPSDLARHLGVTSAAASGIVDRLVARGHVERVPDEHDRRRRRLDLTDSGRREVVAHLTPMFEALVDLDRGLSEGDRAVVEEFLRGAIDAVERIL
ncbi:MarR family transcriptional regulator [Nocardioides panacisoli]|uniref:MarR family winged helix-turn-helix transcriptional regulator n=1 Tax=Nocardioides panacisoli TaxID=627624 RepID=UPI001C62FD4A|nr:MarR family transcriptional regulator [Nocardioides panacisoli]QYJ03355.1 MarR family transcriptional regulator [Nocardioides panacisoli]